MSKLETNTIDNISGSSTLTIGDSNASTISIPKNITLGASGTTITVPSGATITNNGTQTGFGGTNTPYFYATKKNSNQTISNVTATKVTFDNIVLDTASDWDSTNNRYTPQTAGKYLFLADIMVSVNNVSELIVASLRIRKNDTVNISYHQLDARNNYLGYSNNLSTFNIVDMNGSSDFMEVHAYISDNSGSPEVSGNLTQGYTSFMAFKIIE